MSALPEDDGRAAIPAVERVALIARIALEILGSRFPIVDRYRGNDGRGLEGELAPGLLFAANIGPLGSVQVILVRLADLDPASRPGATEVASLKAPIVRELQQMA